MSCGGPISAYCNAAPFPLPMIAAAFGGVNGGERSGVGTCLFACCKNAACPASWAEREYDLELRSN
jgi:hypothetical protein